MLPKLRPEVCFRHLRWIRERDRHQVSYVCEYYEVVHVWHYTHLGAQHSQGAVKLDRLHQPRLRERFPRNGLHPEVCYFGTPFCYGNRAS